MTPPRATSNLTHRPSFSEARLTELERFFRRLVANVVDTDPALLHRPIPLEDIHRSLVPYRTNRRALQLESSEDYEMVLLRLCAGEGSLVRTEPEEARARFERELGTPNPDLGILHRVENVEVSIRPEPLARALAPERDPDGPYTPPAQFAPMPPPIAGLDLPEPEPLLDDELELPTPEPPTDDGLDLDGFGAVEPEPESQALAAPLAPECRHCGESLPAGRPVRFCPHCGQRQAPPECPRCHGEVEPGWRHCVGCGAPLSGG